MSNKANAPIGETGQPLDKTRAFGSYFITNPTSGWPPGYTSDSHFALCVTGNDPNWSPWLLFDLRTGATFRGGYTEARFRAWEQIATATPPQWYTLTPEANYTAGAGPYYCKDGGGTVWLTGQVSRASKPLSGEIILRLPEGFRPAVLVAVQLVAGAGPWCTYGYVHPDGKLALNGGYIPDGYQSNNGISFSVSFPSAS